MTECRQRQANNNNNIGTNFASRPPKNAATTNITLLLPNKQTINQTNRQQQRLTWVDCSWRSQIHAYTRAHTWSLTPPPLYRQGGTWLAMTTLTTIYVLWYIYTHAERRLDRQTNVKTSPLQKPWSTNGTKRRIVPPVQSPPKIIIINAPLLILYVWHLI